MKELEIIGRTAIMPEGKFAIIGYDEKANLYCLANVNAVPKGEPPFYRVDRKGFRLLPKKRIFKKP